MNAAMPLNLNSMESTPSSSESNFVLSPQKAEMFEYRLNKVFKRKKKIAQNQQITCWRVYDHDLPEFPFCIDLYENHVYVAEYHRKHKMSEEGHTQWLEACLQLISTHLDGPNENIYVKQRKGKGNRNDQYEKTGDAQRYFTVMENGLKFLVNLTDYLDTGLFLDHRITRQMVRSEALNKRVLNLFAYTGWFSVYAAAGQASSVTTVDLSKTYLRWAQDNFTINRLKNNEAYHFSHADVEQYLNTLQPNSFDLIIMDPPTFSNSKRMKDILDIQRDHVALLNDALHALTPGGTIYFSNNYTKFVMDEGNIRASIIKNITNATTPFDFEGKLKRWCYRITK
jgi:23S rRNA (cytosine1962-C5)-methyltransferase